MLQMASFRVWRTGSWIGRGLFENMRECAVLDSAGQSGMTAQRAGMALFRQIGGFVGTVLGYCLIAIVFAAVWIAAIGAGAATYAFRYVGF